MKGRIHLEDDLKSEAFNNIPIRFFYGSIDFNPMEVYENILLFVFFFYYYYFFISAKRLAEVNKVKNSLHIISDAGH